MAAGGAGSEAQVTRHCRRVHLPVLPPKGNGGLHTTQPCLARGLRQPWQQGSGRVWLPDRARARVAVEAIVEVQERRLVRANRRTSMTDGQPALSSSALMMFRHVLSCPFAKRAPCAGGALR